MLKMSGFIVMVSPAAKADLPVVNRALARLNDKLAEIARIVPYKALDELKKVRVWVERDNPDNAGAVYHPDVEWLKEHGYNTDKAHCVEIGNLRNFLDWSERTQPMMILHEMAHAYHYLVLGQDDKDVEAIYDAAVKSGKYDKVPFVSGGERKYYGLNNKFEFFAEASEAYFGYNDFYPFDQKQLLEFDRATYEEMVKAWGFPRGRSTVIGSSATPEVLKGLGR